jgi:hypothetical protein
MRRGQRDGGDERPVQDTQGRIADSEPPGRVRADGDSDSVPAPDRRPASTDVALAPFRYPAVP